MNQKMSEANSNRYPNRWYQELIDVYQQDKESLPAVLGAVESYLNFCVRLTDKEKLSTNEERNMFESQMSRYYESALRQPTPLAKVHENSVYALKYQNRFVRALVLKKEMYRCHVICVDDNDYTDPTAILQRSDLFDLPETCLKLLPLSFQCTWQKPDFRTTMNMNIREMMNCAIKIIPISISNGLLSVTLVNGDTNEIILGKNFDSTEDLIYLSNTPSAKKSGLKSGSVWSGLIKCVLPSMSSDSEGKKEKVE